MFDDSNFFLVNMKKIPILYNSEKTRKAKITLFWLTLTNYSSNRTRILDLSRGLNDRQKLHTHFETTPVPFAPELHVISFLSQATFKVTSVVFFIKH